MQGKGYTILETMIVLAISASLFVTAVIALGGRQQEIQFSQAVRDLDSRLQDFMNDISTGFFNNEGNISCELSGAVTNANSEPRLDPSGSDAQGSSEECVFIGKAIQFHPRGQSATEINVYNIVGRRSAEDGSAAVTLQQSRPIAVGPLTLGDTELAGEVSEQPLDWGLRVTDVKTSPTDEFGTLVFLTSFSNTLQQTVGDATVSNNQAVRFGVLPGSLLGSDTDNSIGDNKVDVVSLIRSITDANPTIVAQRPTYIDMSGATPITICLQNPEQTKRAAIVIGKDGSTSTSVEFDTYDKAICGV